MYDTQFWFNVDPSGHHMVQDSKWKIC